MTDIDEAFTIAAEFVAGLDEDGEPSPNRPMGPLDQVRIARAVLDATAEVRRLRGERARAVAWLFSLASKLERAGARIEVVMSVRTAAHAIEAGAHDKEQP